jgi:hypothetical protein
MKLFISVLIIEIVGFIMTFSYVYIFHIYIFIFIYMCMKHFDHILPLSTLPLLLNTFLLIMYIPDLFFSSGMIIMHSQNQGTEN